MVRRPIPEPQPVEPTPQPAATVEANSGTVEAGSAQYGAPTPSKPMFERSRPVVVLMSLLIVLCLLELVTRFFVVVSTSSGGEDTFAFGAPVWPWSPDSFAPAAQWLWFVNSLAMVVLPLIAAVGLWAASSWRMDAVGTALGLGLLATVDALITAVIGETGFADQSRLVFLATLPLGVGIIVFSASVLWLAPRTRDVLPVWRWSSLSASLIAVAFWLSATTLLDEFGADDVVALGSYSAAFVFVALAARGIGQFGFNIALAVVMGVTLMGQVIYRFEIAQVYVVSDNYGKGTLGDGITSALLIVGLVLALIGRLTLAHWKADAETTLAPPPEGSLP